MLLCLCPLLNLGEVHGHQVTLNTIDKGIQKYQWNDK